jgi:glycosyltransferase involved in cell wall biosynthesis
MQHSNLGLACSEVAAESYFGKNWKTDDRWKLFFCGEDLGPFANDLDARSVRRSLGISDDAFVVGHVGSFRDMQKNHIFLVRIARELIEADGRLRLLLVGDGALRPDVEREVARAGIKDQVIFTGTRADVPQLMGAMDLFLFPSLSEGLGLVMVEAQAAGLKCVHSDVIPREAIVIPQLCWSVSLTKSPADWAQAVLDLLEVESPVARKDALQIVKNSKFNIRYSIKELERIYSSARKSRD